MVVGEQAAADLQRLLVQRLGLGVLPLGIEVEGQVVVAVGGVGMVVGEQAAADLQRLLVQRLGLGVLTLGTEVVRQVVVAVGGVGLVVGEQAAADLAPSRTAAWPEAYLPCALKFIAMLL